MIKIQEECLEWKYTEKKKKRNLFTNTVYKQENSYFYLDDHLTMIKMLASILVLSWKESKIKYYYHLNFKR